MNLIPPPFNAGANLVKSFAKLTTGSNSGNYIQFVKNLPHEKIYNTLKEGRGKIYEEDNKIEDTIPIQKSLKLKNNKAFH